MTGRKPKKGKVRRKSMKKEEYISQFAVRVENAEDGSEMCYVTRRGENMCFEMSVCEFEKWLFYRHGIHSRPIKQGGSVGFLIRDITPPEKLIRYTNDFLGENMEKLEETA